MLKLEHDEHAASMDPLELARLNLKTYTDEIARLEPLMTPEYRRQEAQDAVAAARKMNKKAKPEEALVALQEAQRARLAVTRPRNQSAKKQAEWRSVCRP